MHDQEAMPLAEARPGKGAGVYLLYYRGPFPAYAPLTAKNASNFSVPIYVGKAEPKGGRTGIEQAATSQSLVSNRLNSHRKSIKATNLSLDHFWVRYLIVEVVWVGFCEKVLINRLVPLWNSTLGGFGSNQPGKGREEQAFSGWDTLHPGRGSMQNLRGRVGDVAAIEARIAAHFAGNVAEQPLLEPDD